MRRIIFFYEDGIINDATSFYVGVIERAAIQINMEFVKTKSLHDIKRDDIVFTIYSKNFIQAFIKHPFNKSIFWAQGVEPEESFLYCNRITYWIKSLMEFISIKFSTLLFMVSESMFEHYKQKYRLKRTHNIIMPCYNAEKLQKIDYSKYNHPSFVFAGGTSSWHCAKEIIETYKYIENEVPESSITLLSSAKVQFEKLIKEYGVKNYEIKYVPLDQLQIELMKYKYGFLIRDKHIINNVATPTKMSSYLGAGIIPIFTNAIDDFVKHIHLGAFSLLFKTPIDTKTIAEAIIHFENTDHDYSEYLSIVNNVFDDYYNSQKYISIISPELLKL